MDKQVAHQSLEGSIHPSGQSFMERKEETAWS